MTTAFYSHPDCRAHDMGAGHPECPQRLDAIADHLISTGLDVALDMRDAPEVQLSDVDLAHESRYVDELRELLAQVTLSGEPRAIDPDTVASPGTWKAMLRAAGAAVAATDAVLDGEVENAFCSVRPPGHHATRDAAMGFCFFNNVSIAARHALDVRGLKRVAIVDFDVHHGNGTEDIFRDEDRVFYMSTHEAGIYPSTGSSEDNRAMRLSNALLLPGSGGEHFRAVWQQKLLPELTAYQPEIILVSAGFDAHRLDPLANLNVQADDYFWLSQELARIANEFSQGRIISMLEGGYSLTALRECSVAHLRGLMT